MKPVCFVSFFGVKSSLHANIFWAEMLDIKKGLFYAFSFPYPARIFTSRSTWYLLIRETKSKNLKATKSKVLKASLWREERTLKAKQIGDLKRVASCLRRLAAQAYYYFLYSSSFILQNTTRIKNFVFDLRFV